GGRDSFGDIGGAKRHSSWYEEPPGHAALWVHSAERQREAKVDDRERNGDRELHGSETLIGHEAECYRTRFMAVKGAQSALLHGVAYGTTLEPV
ncbi:MAG: hypothetical protein V2A65_02455, partial [Candidatus Omnitrophota bacterium]